AAVLGQIQRRTEYPNLLIVVRIDPNLAVIRRPGIGGAHAGPGEPFVFGAVHAAQRDIFDQRVDDIRILAIHFHRASAHIAGRRQALGQLRPVLPAIHGLVDSTVRPAAVVAEDGPPSFISGCVERVRTLWLDRNLGYARIVINEERLNPVCAAISGLIYAAFFV